MGSYDPRRVDLQRAKVELGGSHLREPRAASIRRQVCASGADATDNASAICVRVVPYDRVLDADQFLAAANVDGGRVRGIIRGNRHEAEVEHAVNGADGTSEDADAISRDRAVGDGQGTAVCNTAAAFGAIFRDCAACDDHCRARVHKDTTPTKAGVVSRDCSDEHSAAISDAATKGSAIERNCTVRDANLAATCDIDATVVEGRIATPIGTAVHDRHTVQREIAATLNLKNAKFPGLGSVVESTRQALIPVDGCAVALHDDGAGSI